MPKFQFQPARQGPVSDSGLTSMLAQMAGGGGVAQGLASIQATLDRRASQNMAAARLAQDREELLLRVAQDEASRAAADRRFQLDQQEFALRQQNQAFNQRAEFERLAIARSGEQRAQRGEVRADNAEMRAQSAEARANAGEQRARSGEAREQARFSTSMMNSALEVARNRAAQLEHDERRQFDADLMGLIEGASRIDTVIPAMASPVFGSFFRQPGMVDDTGAPTPKLRDALARALRARGFPGEDDQLSAAVDGLLTPRLYRSLDLDHTSRHSIEPILHAGAMAGLSSKDVMDRIKALAPEITVGPDELEQRLIDDASRFGKFVTTVDEQTGRMVNARLAELQNTAEAMQGQVVPINETTLADLEPKQLPQSVQKAWQDAGFNSEQLKEKSFWSAFQGQIVYDPSTGEVLPAVDADSKLFSRVKPALEATLKAAPWLGDQLRATAGAQARKTTQSQRDQVRLGLSPPKPKSAGASTSGSAAQQSNAVNGTRNSDQQFIEQNMPWLLNDFTQGLGLPENYNPER